MKEYKIEINIGGGTQVVVGRGTLARAGEYITVSGVRRAAIISDENVFPLYGRALRGALSVDCCEYILPAGEEYKTISSLEKILEFLAENGLERGDAVVALGGGVVSDIAGLTASIYLRGVKLYCIPTTLLSAVDASIGGKTAVDLSRGKNLAGSFYPASAVICDCDLFATLPGKVFADGCAEVLKYGAVFDEELFSLVERGGIRDDIAAVVAKCIEYKKSVVEKDEFDRGERRLLNFGHTIGHALERASNYEISHGSAVAAGMCAVCRASDALGISREPTYDRMRRATEALSLPAEIAFSASELMQYMLSDKKRDGDYIDLIVPERIGKCVLRRTAAAELPRLLSAALGE